MASSRCEIMLLELAFALTIYWTLNFKEDLTQICCEWTNRLRERESHSKSPARNTISLEFAEHYIAIEPQTAANDFNPAFLVSAVVANHKLAAFQMHGESFFVFLVVFQEVTVVDF